MSGRRSSAKALIVTDDEDGATEELNPFSFREFLRWKQQNLDQDQDLDQDRDRDRDQDRDRDRADTHSQSGSCQGLFDATPVTFDPEVGFFSEPSLAAREEEEEEEEEEEGGDWGQSFLSGVDSTSSVCTEEETRFSSRPEEQPIGAGGAENYEGDDETSIAEPVTSCRRRSGRSDQIRQLKEENAALRRTIRELQRRSDTQERRVTELSEEIVQRTRREEKEARDLESMVQSVEQNLHSMTRRALKAENGVSKLEAELQRLQVEADSLRAESELMKTMKRNAQVASEHLNKTTSHAQSCIRQLMGEAETLLLVSQLLQSIDKISSLPSDS
ncbi:endosome-associated-trafficking regulator 1 isoform X2 [Brachionichthys hirsutus]|uniref:endosome-associated-trafficking regulator 1 isoform X2 n=1 Tax=Brachionichthys hirsutus TaxID=412623 RepID=UPI0036044598